MKRSPVTGWRWAQAGLVHPINLNGRLYLTREEILEFENRAAQGDFAKAPAGAAATAHQRKRTR